jgi:hypothetical protein
MNNAFAVGDSDIERLLIAPLLSRTWLLKVFSFQFIFFLFVKLNTNIIFLFDITKYFIIFLYKKVERYHHDSPPPECINSRDIYTRNKKKYIINRHQVSTPSVDMWLKE